MLTFAKNLNCTSAKHSSKLDALYSVCINLTVSKNNDIFITN